MPELAIPLQPLRNGGGGDGEGGAAENSSTPQRPSVSVDATLAVTARRNERGLRVALPPASGTQSVARIEGIGTAAGGSEGGGVGAGGDRGGDQMAPVEPDLTESSFLWSRGLRPFNRRSNGSSQHRGSFVLNFWVFASGVWNRFEASTKLMCQFVAESFPCVLLDHYGTVFLGQTPAAEYPVSG